MNIKKSIIQYRINKACKFFTKKLDGGWFNSTYGEVDVKLNLFYKI